MVLYLYYFLMYGREQMCRLIICGPISQFFSCAHSYRQLLVPWYFLYEVSGLILSGPRFDNVHRFYIFVYAPTSFYLFSWLFNLFRAWWMRVTVCRCYDWRWTHRRGYMWVSGRHSRMTGRPHGKLCSITRSVLYISLFFSPTVLVPIQPFFHSW